MKSFNGSPKFSSQLQTYLGGQFGCIPLQTTNFPESMSGVFPRGHIPGPSPSTKGPFPDAPLALAPALALLLLTSEIFLSGGPVTRGFCRFSLCIPFELDMTSVSATSSCQFVNGSSESVSAAAVEFGLFGSFFATVVESVLGGNIHFKAKNSILWNRDGLIYNMRT